MTNQIAVITTEYLRSFLIEALQPLSIPYSLHTYSAFSELPDIFTSLPENIRGVMTSGGFPASVLQHYFPNSGRIIMPFNNDDSGMLRLLFQLFQKNKNLSSKRIYADVFDVANINIDDFIVGSTLIKPLSYERLDKFSSSIEVPTFFDNTTALEHSIKALPLDNILKAEDNFAEKHLRLWKAGEVDVNITRFSSIMPRLQAEGLNVYFAYPGATYVQYVFVSLLRSIKIAQFHKNQPAAIVVGVKMPEHMRSSFSSQRWLENQMDVLSRFNKNSQLNWVLRKGAEWIEIISSREIVEGMTAMFSSCCLRETLPHSPDAPLYVGYGLGQNVYQARINAMDAYRDASMTPGGMSCLINESDELIKPLSAAGNTLKVPRRVSDELIAMAQKAGVSSITLAKILYIANEVPNGQLTAKYMAYKLEITQRSANRFLKNLLETGIIAVTGQKQSLTRGRPELVYRVVVDVQ